MPYDYAALVVEPVAADQPFGTSVTFAWRGDNPTDLMDNQSPMLDADHLDFYGEPIAGLLTLPDLTQTPVAANAVFPWTDPSWQDSLVGVAGDRFVQTRITSIGNTEPELNPTLTSYGLAYYRSDG